MYIWCLWDCIYRVGTVSSLYWVLLSRQHHGWLWSNNVVHSTVTMLYATQQTVQQPEIIFVCICLHTQNVFFPVVLKLKVGIDRPFEVSTSHAIKHTPPVQSYRVCVCVKEWSALHRGWYLHNIQQNQDTNIQALSGISGRDPSNWAAADLSLIPHGHRDRHSVYFLLI